MFRSVIPTLRVRDSRRSEKLFRALRFEVVWEDQAAPDFPRFVELARDDVAVFLSEHEGDGPFATNLYFVVEDAPALFADLEPDSLEVSVEQAPEESPWGHQVFVLQDADGNTLRFGSPMPAG